MAKIYGLFGAMSGKVADVVMSVRNGQQIVRKYQPVVRNPKTANQYSTRARFKLLSQLAAIMAPFIAIARDGGVSPRNIFTRLNFPKTLFSLNDMEASIDLNKVQLTKSTVALGGLTVSRNTEANSIEVAISVTPSIDRVVYAAFTKTGGELLAAANAVVNDDGTGTFATSLNPAYWTEETLVLAYGVRDNNETASIYFGNLTAPTAEDVAQLLVSRTLTERDITLTETRGYTLPSSTSREVELPKSKAAAKK